MSLTLDALLSPLGIAAPNVALREMQLDSRAVQPGDLFLALPGHAVDGRQFMNAAAAKGAAAILFEPAGLDSVPECAALCIAVPGLARCVSELAGRFYGEPSRQLQLIGVTGTNGKSTTTQLIANWRSLLGGQAGVMGTIGNGLFGALQPTENTTASPLAIQQQLAQQLALGADLVAMEVSSHGLVQHRVSALSFAVAVFTNLSRDHLDYHGDMDAYAAAKRQLFSMVAPADVVLNADDAVGRQWLQQIPQAVTYTLLPENAPRGSRYVEAVAVRFHDRGFSASLRTSWGQGVLDASLLGQFNVSNVLAALAAMLVLGYDFKALLAAAPRLSPVTGRMECFGGDAQPLLVVDYAHTPDGLEKALAAARLHCRGRLFCLVGCGGDRDRGKRPMMASAAEQLADVVILTDDNPRTEAPEAIIADMRGGLSRPDQVRVIHQREQAIRQAWSEARAGDVILIAGKGHEDYQIIGKQKLHYSDRETASLLLGECS
ncbi:UDP-N-acetylmuramoyl-L-alanyl-D-glutamate--2,6-diaminopimelate ligase [Pseudaeromonas sharmana]|uniref:UDP-N-acetylmuramoyl-L-alanyl-D-glutamate--2,6-diaminopimelate ligase n=1 Tax=Pseudaeromonas sharmana TaxID=328412 RepID=A0ABV8CM85_9GAMM